MSEVASVELIKKNESTEAFRAVLIVGKQFSDQIQEAREANDEVAEAMLMSFGMTQLQDAIKEHPAAWDVIRRSCGNKWGFRTDRDTWTDGYGKDVVIPVYCEALLNKLRPVGNEFNIISSSLYVTKEGWKGKLERLPGVTLVDCRAEVFADPEVRPFVTEKGQQKFKMTATIGATASCEVWGRPVSVEARMIDGKDERLQVSAMSEFADQVIDQLKGKIEARMYERLYEKVKTLAKIGPQGEQAEPAKTITERKQVRIVAVKSHDKQLTADEVKAEESKGAAKSKPPKPLDIVEKWKATGEAIGRMLADDQSAADAAKTIWVAMGKADSAAKLEDTCSQYREQMDFFGDDIKGRFRKFKTALLESFEQQKGGAT